MKLKNNTQKELITITQHPDYTTEIIKILHSNLLPKGKQEHISAYHEKDIASTLELLNAEERSKFYPIFQPKNLADILEHSENPILFLNELGMRKKLMYCSRWKQLRRWNVCGRWKKQTAAR